MFKKILTLLMSMALILSLTACGGGSTTVKVTNEDGSTQTVVLESLKPQLQNVTPMTDYAGNTSIDQMDYVTFGLDENSQPIEWIVLEKSNNKALLLSKYVLTSHTYNDESVDITWENCTMRKWLNSEYINTIFSKKEQGSIITSDVINNVINYGNAEYGTKGGNNTKDKLFLLSLDEVNKYFNNDNQRVATNKGDSSSSWWLRSPGLSPDNWWLPSPDIDQSQAAYIYYDGSLRENGGDVNTYGGHGVRPALWVKY